MVVWVFGLLFWYYHIIKTKISSSIDANGFFWVDFVADRRRHTLLVYTKPKLRIKYKQWDWQRKIDGQEMGYELNRFSRFHFFPSLHFSLSLSLSVYVSISCSSSLFLLSILLLCVYYLRKRKKITWRSKAKRTEKKRKYKTIEVIYSNFSFESCMTVLYICVFESESESCVREQWHTHAHTVQSEVKSTNIYIYLIMYRATIN